MGVQDLIVTPVYLILFTLLAYLIRPYVTNEQTRKYFLPALFVRFLGAIFLGLVYQYYYGGGDTFNFWTHGSQWIWKAFQEDPEIALELILGKNQYTTVNFEYAQKIIFFFDSDSYFIIRIAGIFDILSFGTYSCTALFFAILSFSGGWVLFRLLSIHFPQHIRGLSIAILFFPSVIFWGSGVLKDSIALSAFLWLITGLFQLIDQKKVSLMVFLLVLISAWLILSVKPYILYCTIPAVAAWLYIAQIAKMRSWVLKVVLTPILFLFFAGFAYLATLQATKNSNDYSLENLARRAWITAYDIRFYTGRNAGSGYSLGTQDGTFESMIRLAPSAVFVSFFRPFLWEVVNPFMLIMALESLLFLLLFLMLLFRGKWNIILSNPFLIFCISFSIMFAFAVGVSTYNFGTLMRYRLPQIPPFLICVFIGYKVRSR